MGNAEERSIFFNEEIRGSIFKHSVFRGEKDRGNCLVINLKELNKLTPYAHFRMELLSLFKEIKDRGHHTITAPLGKNYYKYVRFQWKGNQYKFLRLCFDLSSVPRMYAKLMKIPKSL